MTEQQTPFFTLYSSGAAVIGALVGAVIVAIIFYLLVRDKLAYFE
jgi:prolipoprotein diacylglyceryltransferase